MTQYDIISALSLALQEQVPKEAKIFNISLDFVNDPKGDLHFSFVTEHRGHRTMVVMVSVTDGEGRLVAESLVTLLFQV